MNKAIGYIRVSTKDQADNGASLQNQECQIRKYAEYNNYELLNIYSDAGISGFKKVKRPGYDNVMNHINNKDINHIIVYSLSRFSRNTKSTLDAMEKLKKNEVHFHSLSEKIDTSSPMGNFLFIVLSALSQLESEQTGERITDVKEFCKNNLKRYSSPVYGFNNEKSLVVNHQEMEIVKAVHELKRSNLSPRAIAAHLNDVGVKAKEGGIFYHSQINNILKNTIYHKFIG